ncbi:probable serine/threonine-protein kinase fhkB [Drosophila hydei]|uniref:Probable serine/threonine-protein kinase fhkB n=1 Tax=Drosophila hydei TaxID=7224 RepID=A0A6J1LPY0_DROHY|nr:probable serine/threonine-protein kinase fhkB [Drosophila hydei]
MLLLMLMLGAVAGYDHSVNYWQAFAPGKLLQRLDALTAADGQPGRAEALTAQLPMAQAKLDEDADDDEDQLETEADAAEAVDHDDDVDELEADSHSAEGHSGEDYERNYEQFVRQYFDRIPDEADDSDGDAVADHDDSVESQAEASSVQQQQKHEPKQTQQHCRRVRRKGQLCEICREPRNNEVSETCSYSHEEQPELYAYGSGSQYKRYRDLAPDEDQSEEQPAARQRRNERHTTIVQPADGSSSSSSSSASSLCERRMVGKSVCYECKDSGGQQLRRCYDAAMNKESKSSIKPHARQEQRIYKRTISYSYAQGSRQADPDADGGVTTAAPTLALNSTVMPTSTTATSLPPARRPTRVLRRRLPASATAA